MRPRNHLVVLALFLFSLFAALDARAAGTLKLKNAEVNEVSGGWHLYVTIELPKSPLTAHQPMKFLFTKTAAHIDERSCSAGGQVQPAKELLAR